MNQNILLLISAAITLLAFPLYFRLAKKYNIVDVPNERSSHDYVTIRGAGILLIISCLFVAFGLREGYYLMSGLALASIVGYVDDRGALTVILRTTLYALAVFLAFMELSLFQDLPWWIAALFFVVGLGIINAYNFMDGINGITGIYSLVFLGSVLLIHNYLFDIGWIADALPYFVIFLLIFGYFNFRKRARTFIGDAGSIPLGLIAVFLLIFLVKKTDEYGFIVLLAVYGVDSVGTIILRLIRRENIFKAHRSHLYQDMTNIVGHSHLKISLLYGFVQLGINLIWLANFNYQFISNQILLLLIFIPLILFYLRYKKKHGLLSFKPEIK